MKKHSIDDIDRRLRKYASSLDKRPMSTEEQHAETHRIIEEFRELPGDSKESTIPRLWSGIRSTVATLLLRFRVSTPLRFGAGIGAAAFVVCAVLLLYRSPAPPVISPAPGHASDAELRPDSAVPSTPEPGDLPSSSTENRVAPKRALLTFTPIQAVFLSRGFEEDAALPDTVQFHNAIAIIAQVLRERKVAFHQSRFSIRTEILVADESIPAREQQLRFYANFSSGNIDILPGAFRLPPGPISEAVLRSMYGEISKRVYDSRHVVK